MTITRTARTDENTGLDASGGCYIRSHGISPHISIILKVFNELFREHMKLITNTLNTFDVMEERGHSTNGIARSTFEDNLHDA